MQKLHHKRLPLRVAHILYSGLGGHGSVFFSLCEADVAKEMTSQAIFYGIEPTRESYVKQCKRLEIPFQYVEKKQGVDFKAWRNLRKSLKAFDPDVVVGHSCYMVVPVWRYARRHGKPLIMVEHDPNSKKNRLSWFWSGLAQRWADAIVNLSPIYQEEQQEKLGKWFQANKNHIIPNGIDVSAYSPPEKEQAHDFFHLSMHSRLTPQKDHPALLKALARLHRSGKLEGVKVSIAGDGEMRSMLEEMTRELELTEKVHWLGMLNEAEVIHLLQQTDLYLHPTHSETMSTSLMQAMAVGLPVLTTDVPGVSHMALHGENAWCTPESDVPALEQAIIKLTEKAKLRRQLGLAARAYAVSHFSQESMFQKYLTLIQQLSKY
jgi:glycosyltransferase involved in cell wall biosynthesis